MMEREEKNSLDLKTLERTNSSFTTAILFHLPPLNFYYQIRRKKKVSWMEKLLSRIPAHLWLNVRSRNTAIIYGPKWLLSRNYKHFTETTTCIVNHSSTFLHISAHCCLPGAIIRAESIPSPSPGIPSYWSLFSRSSPLLVWTSSQFLTNKRFKCYSSKARPPSLSHSIPFLVCSNICSHRSSGN